MDGFNGPLTYQPFQVLGQLLEQRAPFRSKAGRSPTLPENKPTPVTAGGQKDGPRLSDEEAFLEAMKGVRPLKKDDLHLDGPPKSVPVAPFLPRPDTEIRSYLDDLVRYGKGFILSQTPEYVEGTSGKTPPEFAQRLHEGRFSIQAHLDLHGLSVVQAREAFEDFLHACLVAGKGAVLIIHGRGISSPQEPVLKNKVREWLTRTRWRKWVVAFASARSYDGGTGATYVLLRQRLPLKLKRTP